MHRLQTDRSLALFAGQFVPLKVKTTGEQWTKWATKYPVQGRSIPIIYVIRADGTMLYGQSGMLEGPALPQLLLATLKQSGRTFSDGEVALLANSVEQAKQALQRKDQSAAVKALTGLSRLGELGALNSYSILATEADQLVKQVTDTANAAIEEAKSKLGQEETAFDGVLALVEAQGIYAALPVLKRTTTTALRDVNKDDRLRPLVEQAEAVDRARRYAKLAAGNGNKQAVAAYELVITRFPGTAAARVAREELAEMDPQSSLLPVQPLPGAPAEFRTWTDSTGKFTTEAKLLQRQGGTVTLQKRDGKVVTFPIQRLSAQDREFLKQGSSPDG